MTHIFINPKGEYPRHAGDILLEHPDYDGENLPDGWHPVTPTNKPITVSDQIAFELRPVLVDGVYHQVWDIRDLTEAEIQARQNKKPRKSPLEKLGLI